MDAKTFLTEIVAPGMTRCADILPPTDHNVIRLMMTIAGQESEWSHRCQVDKNMFLSGPGRGWWHFGHAGGAYTVMKHPRSCGFARAVCTRLHVLTDTWSVWRALEGHDTLAVAFARLLLWTDSQPITGDMRGGWDTYMRVWQPMCSDPQTWSQYWHEASLAMGLPKDLL